MTGGRREMKKADPARPYIRALFERDRLRFLGTAALYVLEVPAMLLISWVLGEVVDAIGALDGVRLLRLLWVAAGVAVLLGVSETLYYRALGGFTGRALGRYKSYAFRTRASAPSRGRVPGGICPSSPEM